MNILRDDNRGIVGRLIYHKYDKKIGIVVNHKQNNNERQSYFPEDILFPDGLMRGYYYFDDIYSFIV